MDGKNAERGEMLTIVSTLLFLCASIYIGFKAGMRCHDVIAWRVPEFIAGCSSLIVGFIFFLGSFVLLSRGLERIVIKHRKKRQ